MWPGLQVGGRNDGSEGRTKILDSGPSGCKEAWWNQDGGRLKIFELALFHLGNDAVETKHLEKPHITRFHDCLDKTSYQEDEIPPLLRRTISQNDFVSQSDSCLCSVWTPDVMMSWEDVGLSKQVPCPPRCTLLQKCTPLNSRNAFSGKN